MWVVTKYNAVDLNAVCQVVVSRDVRNCRACKKKKKNKRVKTGVVVPVLSHFFNPSVQTRSLEQAIWRLNA